MLGDFKGKNHKIGKGNLYFTENRLDRNEIWWKIITVLCVTYVQKNFRFELLIKQLLTKYQFFKNLLQILHIYKNRIF